MAHLVVGIQEQADDGGKELLQLSRDEVWCSLRGVTESEHTSHTELGVIARGEVGELLEQGDNSLTRGQLASQNINEADGCTCGGDVLIIIGVKLGDNVHSLDHELSGEVLHALDLHATTTDSLDEEGQRLGSCILLDVSVGSHAHHKVNEITEVVAKERRVVSDVAVEDFENDLVALLVLSLNGGLEDVDHAGDERLHGLDSLGVAVGLNDQEDGTNGADDVDANLLAIRVLDAALEQLEKLVGVVAEVGWVVLKDGVENVGANLTSNNIVAGVELDKLLEEIITLAELHVSTNNGRDQASDGVADRRSGLFEGALNEMVASKRTLVLRNLLPMPQNKARALNGGELTDTAIFVCDSDLDEEEE